MNAALRSLLRGGLSLLLIAWVVGCAATPKKEETKRIYVRRLPPRRGFSF